MMTGKPLEFEEVSGAEASESGLPNASLEGRYIRVTLARPVPDGGEGADPDHQDLQGSEELLPRRRGHRLRPAARHQTQLGRPAGRLRAGVVQHPVAGDRGGRTAASRISFMNIYPGQAPLVLRAQRRYETAHNVRGRPPRHRPDRSAGAAPTRRRSRRWTGFEFRNVQSRIARSSTSSTSPTTHSFSLYHDFTETGQGTDRYLNIVRRGSTVSNPSAKILDTGEKLQDRNVKGEAITKAGIDIGEPVQAGLGSGRRPVSGGEGRRSRCGSASKRLTPIRRATQSSTIS